jgi:hypothetical protein
MVSFHQLHFLAMISFSDFIVNLAISLLPSHKMINYAIIIIIIMGYLYSALQPVEDFIGLHIIWRIGSHTAAYNHEKLVY